MPEPMDNSNPVDIRRVLLSNPSIIFTYVLAVLFMALALYMTNGKAPSPGTILWIFAAGWMGRADEKTSMWWKLSKMSRGDVGEKAE